MDDACGRLSQLLSARVDDELSAAESAELNAHLADCPACAAALRRLEATVAAVRSLPAVAPPPGYLVDLRARQALEAGATPWFRYLRDGLALAGATAALGLMALGLREQAPVSSPAPLFASSSPSSPSLPSPLPPLRAVTVPEPALVVAQATQSPLPGSPSSSSVSFLGVVAPVAGASAGGEGRLTRDAAATAAVDSRVELASLSRQAFAAEVAGPEATDDEAEFGPPVLAGFEGLRGLFGSLVREVAPGTPEGDEDLPGRILLDVSDEPAFFAALKADLGRRSAVVADAVEYARGEETRLHLTVGAPGAAWSALFTNLEAALWRMPSVQGVLCVADDDGTPGAEARVMITVRPVPRRP